jgi:hypothetical protein
MRYRLWFRDAGGYPLTLTGFKVVRDDPGLDVWADMTTLYVHIPRGHVSADAEDQAETVASGVLRIPSLAFALQLTTFRAWSPTGAGGGRACCALDALFSVISGAPTPPVGCHHPGLKGHQRELSTEQGADQD